jgi:hypothetical protein
MRDHVAMPIELPIACTLTPAELRERQDQLGALAARALRSRERTAAGERLTFAGGEDVERALRAAIDAEARCCPFLRMELRRDGDVLVLDVAAPDEARPIVAELFAA